VAEVDPRIGTELAGYRIQALLRPGGPGVAYLAEDVRLNRRVVLQLPSPDVTADERFRERFLRESRLAASLDHASIVTVYEAGEADGHPYVALQYVEGAADLAGLLAGGERLEPERALLVVTELAEALDAARWSCGLVHASLTPSNVLVAPPGDAGSRERVLLFGFGLRRELQREASVSGELGSLVYLAPEQIEGKPASPRTDVYALGCLLFHCLTGEAPFSRGSPRALLSAHLHEPPPSARRRCPDLPAGIDRVVQTALAKWPEERYSTCGELAASAQAALALRRQPERNPGDERLSPLAPARTQGAASEELPDSVVGPDRFVQRLGARGWKSSAAIGAVALVAILVAGFVWLTSRDPGEGTAATPPQAGAGTPEPVAVTAAATAEPAEPDGVSTASSDLSLLPGSLVRIDGATGEVVARLAIPYPKLLAAGGRSVWVLSNEDASDKLVHVDAATNAVTTIFDADVAGAAELASAPPSGPAQLAVTGGSAWLGVILGPLYRFTPGTSAGEPVRIEVESPWFQWPVAAAGSLWVRNGEGVGRLLRVDPLTQRVLAQLAADQVVASGAGFLWALASTRQADTRLVRIDTETNAIVPIGELGFPWSELAVTGGAVWALDPEDNAIVRLGPLTGAQHERIPVGWDPTALAAGNGAVWVASRDDTVVRYDIATGRLERIEVGGTPTDLVFARGSVWVAVADEPPGDASPAHADGSRGDSADDGSHRRQTRTVAGVRLSFRAPSPDWTPGPIERLPDGGGFRNGSLYVSKDTAGPQNAEAVVFWTGFPDGDHADPCANLLSPPNGPGAAELAAAVARAPGTELVTGPSDVTVGGRPAKHVVVIVREDLGCDPGFFFTWHDERWGPFWAGTNVGATIRVWIIDVGGTRLVIEAETTGEAGSELVREIRQLVRSIRFEGA
jgi:hypothetical protein